MKMRSTSITSLLLATGCALLLLGHSAQAAAYNWTAADGTTWATGWTGGNVPTTSDDLTILGPLNAAGTLNIDVAATAAAKTINVTDTSAVTLTNINSGTDKTLTIQSGLTTGTGAVTIGSATANQGVLIALGGAQTWSIGSGGLTLNNSYSGTGTLTKTGYGTLTLNAANASTGTLTINAGTVVTNGDTAAVLVSGKAVNLGGGTFSYKSTNGATNAQTLGAIGVTAGSNKITSEETGAGTSALTLGTITRTTGSTVNLVTLGTGATIVSTPARAFNSGIFYNGDYAIATAGGNVRAVIYGTDTNTSNVTGVLTNTGNMNYNVQGTSSMSAINLTGGTVRFDGNYTLTATGSNSIAGFLTNGATSAVISGSGTVRAGGEIVFATNGGSGDQLTVSSTVAAFNGNSGVTANTFVVKSGAGKLVFGGNNSYFGTTYVNEGILKSTSATGLGSQLGGAISMTTVNVQTANRTQVAAGATLDLAPASTMTVNEAISLNDASLINSGSGTTTLDNGIAAVNLTNLGSGGSAATGTVSFGGGGTGAAATIVVAGGALTNFTQTAAGTGYTGTPTVTFTIAGQTTSTAATATLSSLALNGSSTIGGTGNFIINAVVADGASSGGFSKTGTGTVTLNGANTYTGGTTVSLGALGLGNASGLAATSSVTVSGGTLTSSVANVNLGLGAVSMSSGAITPDGIGTAGSFTLAANQAFTTTGGTLNFDVGTAFDQIIGSGTGTFSLGSGTTLALTLGTGFDYGTTYTLFSSFAGGTVAGSGFTISGYDTSNFTASLSNSGILSFNAIPEPSSYAAFAGAFILGFAALRRRIRR